jgi:hypothetical protein
MEHCLSSKLCAKLGIMGIKTYELIKPSFQDEAIGRTQVSVWVSFTEHDRTYTKWRASKSKDSVAAKYVI